MTESFFKPHFNPNKNINLKLYSLSNLSDINTMSDEMFKFYQRSIDGFNLLSNLYPKKDENKKKINIFLEKISQLNKSFVTDKDKFILTKSSFDTLNYDLFKNLFKQIDCYIGEIERLNNQIKSYNNKDNQQIIQNLNRKISENNIKIRNYEMKINEKIKNEKKLIKEIEYYKKRIIFFKNKININLISRNNRHIKRNHSINKKISPRKLKDNYNHSTYSSRYNSRSNSKGKIFIDNYNKINKSKFYNSTPIKINICNSSPKNNSNFQSKIFPKKDNHESNFENNSNKELISCKNLISVNIDNKYKGTLSPEEENNNNNIIKLNRIYSPDEDIICSFEKRKNNQIIKDKSSYDLINFDKCMIINTKNNLKEMTPKKHIKFYSSLNKNNSEVIMNNFFNITTDEQRNIKKNIKGKETNNLKLYFSSHKNDNYKRNILINKNRNSNNSNISKTNIDKTIKTSTNQQTDVPKSKKFKKFFLKSYSNNNIINNSRCKTFNIKDHKKYFEFDKMKLFKFKKDGGNKLNKNLIFSSLNDEKKINNKKIIFRSLFDKNKPLISEIYENDSISKISNKEKTYFQEKNNFITSSGKKLEAINKMIVNDNSYINIENTKPFINVNKKKTEKEIIDNKEKELKKILKDINEDYNKDIEMLSSQEIKIKYLLSLIDSKEE